MVLCLGCTARKKPEHSYIFEGYTTTESGERAYLFESDELEASGHLHVEYAATCDGHVTEAGADGDCRAVIPYLHRLLPPTYYTSPDDGQNAYLEIPSLNLEFSVEEAY
jgi:hypothetical protein